MYCSPPRLWVGSLECAFFDPPSAKWSVLSNQDRNSTGSPVEGRGQGQDRNRGQGGGGAGRLHNSTTCLTLFCDLEPLLAGSGDSLCEVVGGALTDTPHEGKMQCVHTIPMAASVGSTLT